MAAAPALDKISIGHESLHALLVELKRLASLGRKLNFLHVLPALTVFVHDEGINERHHGLVERVHQDELAGGAHEPLHLRIEAGARFVAQLMAPSALEQLCTCIVVQFVLVTLALLAEAIHFLFRVGDVLVVEVAGLVLVEVQLEQVIRDVEHVLILGRGFELSDASFTPFLDLLVREGLVGR